MVLKISHAMILTRTRDDDGLQEVVIHVSRGDQESFFIVPTQHMTEGLLNMLNLDSHDGIHLHLQETDPNDFEMVVQYLNRGDWAPYLTSDGGTPSLSSWPLTRGIREDWIQDLSLVWVFAVQLRLAPLQLLVLQKLRLLLTPDVPGGLLMVIMAFRQTRYMSTEHDEAMVELLADCIATNYEELMAGQEGGRLGEMMQEDPTLSVAVADLRAEME